MNFTGTSNLTVAFPAPLAPKPGFLKRFLKLASLAAWLCATLLAGIIIGRNWITLGSWLDAWRSSRLHLLEIYVGARACVFILKEIERLILK